ncbi:anhydro-N-acetylmuramic acid kinase [Ureibacillus manganicus]|uniref:Anhydro-N-acetylmuramic acid kinase n=1 Tax=Ureibacillus manganicus DSM 26584 TaxID=1384049 RepID=A0A0A3HYP4_9BACL|nr:anhydro-N-acetylmuramic acid kinase [Ureibacillus manganicus]KGR77721.1 hypothetical protein CD29_13805 [Ureibacillus manganicus DSM 26584]
MRVCGLMSGTSLDGLDIAIVDFSMTNAELEYELKHFVTIPYDNELKLKLHELMEPNVSIQKVSSMNMYLGELYATYIKEALVDSEIEYDSIDLISSHGQTIWHEPNVCNHEKFARPNTLQIGDISVLAEKTKIPVIGDFRTRDMAAGGQGAPLVPFADYYLFQHEEQGRILVNIGGIANLTVVPHKASSQNVIAYDTGPGNMIIDFFVSKYTNGQQSFDKNGDFAKSGVVHAEFLEYLLNNDYFQQSAPKSTGRELFGQAYSERIWDAGDQYHLTPLDKISTVTMFTAKTLANEIVSLIEPFEVKEVFISGGGVHNSTLLNYLIELLPETIRVEQTDVLGIQHDAKEAFVFALLGFLGFNKIPNSLPSSTGANRQTVMGKIAW